MFWKPSVAVRSDVATFLVRLCEKLSGVGWSGADSEWIDTLRNRDDDKERKNALV